MTLSPGTRIGPYEIAAPLGAGGMGVVYRARDPRLGRDVALKVLPEHLAADRSALARFEREARAVAALSHPNILAIYDVGEHQGASYVVTELLEGETLRERLDRTAFTWTNAAGIGAAVAEGVAAAHARGIVHRDLKPENIFLTSDGQVKILDFGIAAVRSVPTGSTSVHTAPDHATLTQTGTIIGTAGYMSPEQVRGARTEAPSDLFSLGCVLYEMVAGRRAFERETAVQTLSAILEHDPPPLAESGRPVPPGLDRLIARCLEKDPARRLQSARDLSAELKALTQAPGGAAATGEAATGDPPVPETSVRTGSRPFVSLAVVLIVAVALIAITVTPLRERVFGRSGPAGSGASPAAGEASGPAGTPGTPGPPAATNPDAYRSYQQARYLIGSASTDEDNRQAIDLLERAVALDADFAAAHAALARATVQRRTRVEPEQARELEQKAFAAVERALSLDPNLAEAYLARGDLLWSASYRFPHVRAAREYRRALELNPGLDGAHDGIARVLAHVGLFDESLRHSDEALASNPSNGFALWHTAEVLLWRGNDARALAAFESLPPLVFPAPTQANIVFALHRLGRGDEAAARLREAVARFPDDPGGTLPAMEALLAAGTDPATAERKIAVAAGRGAFNPSHHAAHFMASAWARLGRPGEAVRALREAADTGFPCAPLFAGDPTLDPIREDPGFKAFLAEMQRQTEEIREELYPGGGN